MCLLLIQRFRIACSQTRFTRDLLAALIANGKLNRRTHNLLVKGERVCYSNSSVSPAFNIDNFDDNGLARDKLEKLNITVHQGC